MKALQALQAVAEKNSGRPLTQANLTQAATSGKSGDARKRREYPDWQFKNEGNKQSLKKTIKLKGVDTEVTYYWCKHHNKDQGMWVRHKPRECKNKDRTPPAATATQPSLVARATILDQE